ncbi:integrase, catalytic region, zinc finger, CCHC-type containing protein [Tanacetum coccineum]|uniref:Integrase, catalytic region, zinc finger, CCHC-type containing protein n=1 Tax=Tanacetum coccineum TaxID=301880 RepID=A0ABQ4Z1N7_9ASTR
MDRNNVRSILVLINVKFLNCLQAEWSKYVTMVRHNQTGDTVSYDVLYDSLVQFELHVLASKAKKAAKNHDTLAFLNQAVIQDGRVDIQTKNEGYGGNGNKNAGRQNRNQTFNAGTGNDERNQIVQRVPRTESTPGKVNVQCYNCNEKGHYARDCQKPRVCDAKYFREQMLLAMKDEAGSNLNNEENDFMLDTSYGEETMEELTAIVMLMARIQLVDGNTDTVPSYDAKAVSEVVQLVLWIVDSGCSKHITGNLQLLRNFIEKFMGTVRFGNDHFAAITGYGDYVQGNLMMCHVYYVEGLGHNLFLVGQFCDGDLEVAFHLNTCYVWNLEGDDLLTGSRDLNIYAISIFEMVTSSPVCLMSRATSTKSWYTWVYFLRTKDAASKLDIDFVNQVLKESKGSNSDVIRMLNDGCAVVGVAAVWWWCGGNDDVDFEEMMVRVTREMVVRVAWGCDGRGGVAEI